MTTHPVTNSSMTTWACALLHLCAMLLVIGCTAANDSPMLRGLDDPKLRSMLASDKNVRDSINVAQMTTGYRCVLEEVKRRQYDWIWSVGYYVLDVDLELPPDVGANAAVLIIYEDRFGRLGYVTNVTRMTGFHGLSMGEPLATSSLIAGPTPSYPDRNAEKLANAKRLAHAKQSLHDVVYLRTQQPLPVEHGEITDWRGDEIAVLEFVGPNGRAYAVGIDSVGFGASEGNVEGAEQTVVNICTELFKAGGLRFWPPATQESAHPETGE